MAAEPEVSADAAKPKAPESGSQDGNNTEDIPNDSRSIDTSAEDDSDEDEDEDDEEPKLKYARLTSQLLSVYRNGDATSAFLVAGDKMFIGTHNGNVHVISLPSFRTVKVYHAHSASITAISISPFPPPAVSAKLDPVSRVASQATPVKPSSISSGNTSSPRTPRPQNTVPNTPSNQVYIATSSIDGNVCVQSLVDVRDVQLRNFARPVQAVAVSPDYKNDRTYISGGLAGNLVLTSGGRPGASTSTTTGTASAAASGWLGTIGLGGNSGKDTVLHSGEGAISTIKWSLTGKFVAWVNEKGVKIMRSNLQLDSADAESAWKRIGHIDRPDDNGWEEMAGVWKARVEWIDEQNLETDNDDEARESAASSMATSKLRQQASKASKRIEKLLIGWGETMWIINVHPGGVGVGKHVGERSVGRAEIIKILRMDCIISGLSLYTPTLLLVLAYITPDDGDDEEPPPSPPKGHKSKGSTASTGSEPSGGIKRRQNALSPELRLIDLGSSEEVDTDGLTVSRFERLSASDYHLAVLPAAKIAPQEAASRGALEALTGMGSGMWNATVSVTNATINATTLLGSSASVRSGSSKSDAESSIRASSLTAPVRQAAHAHLATPGMKIFIHSPFDCILATKRDLSDHFLWLMEHQKYEQAWSLIEEYPEVVSSTDRQAEPGPSTPPQGSTDDFFYDSTSADGSSRKLVNSAVEKEKRRVGELWIQQLVAKDDWTSAGKICGKVLGTSTRWEHWVYTFASAKKFDQITNFIPTTQLQPPLPSSIYEIVLGHYSANDRPRLQELLERWPSELFDIKAITDVLENQLKYRDVREDSIEGGEKGRDWRIVMESLGKLYVAGGRPRDGLKCYFKLQDADTAMNLIKDFHLVDVVSDDIPGFILLRVSKEQERSASKADLEQLTSEAISLLVDEAQHGLVRPETVVQQLQDRQLPLYLFFYLRSLWKGSALEDESGDTREHLVVESKSLVDGHADLAIELFAMYDRGLLMGVLRTSTSYSFERACEVCEELDYIPELVHLYSKTGHTNRALFLIIDRLADVSQAIAFAKQQDDKELWNDLLDYSMDKPRFIRGLLEEVGTSIDPVTLVRRIPEGLEIDGLREGLSRMIKEHEIQYSISSGVARVLRGEVALAQTSLRVGQRKGVKFDVVHKEDDHVDVATSDVQTDTKVVTTNQSMSGRLGLNKPKSGHCVGCHEPFSEDEKETLVGFACGHVFHLPHLLSFNNPEEQPVTPPELQSDEAGEYTGMHSVGAKVTHARILRDKIKDGCPVCCG